MEKFEWHLDVLERIGSRRCQRSAVQYYTVARGFGTILLGEWLIWHTRLKYDLLLVQDRFHSAILVEERASAAELWSR